MPGVHCCVIGCNNSYYKAKRLKQYNEDIFSMYCFPKDANLRKIWVKKCKLINRNPNTARVCFMHFSEEQFEIDMEAKIMGIKRTRKLKPGAIPDRRLTRSITPERKRILAQSRKYRLERRSLKKDINNLISCSTPKNKVKKNLKFRYRCGDTKQNQNLKEKNDNTVFDHLTSCGVSDTDEVQDSNYSANKSDKSDEKCEQVSKFNEAGSVEDCLTAVGLVLTENSLKSVKDDCSSHSDENQRLENFRNEEFSQSVESEMEKIFSSPCPSVKNDDEVLSNMEIESEKNICTDKFSCPNSESLRHENERLKLRLAFFQSKLSQVVHIYHCAEAAARNEVRTEFKKELKRYRNANAELTLNNSHYLNVLRSTLSEHEFRNRITNRVDRQYWTSDDISNAQELRSISPKAYLFLRNQMKIILPDISLLEDEKLSNSENVVIKTENE